jgi:hypothetical protein
MMRIIITPAKLFAVTGSKYALSKQTPKKTNPTHPPTTINYSVNAYCRGNLAENALIAAAYKF